MRKVKQWEVNWTVSHLDMLRITGTWAVPRSGLIFMKTGEKEVTLAMIAPHMAEMTQTIIPGKGPVNQQTLLEFQQEDFWCIAARARAGGFTVKSAVSEIKEVEEESSSI